MLPKAETFIEKFRLESSLRALERVKDELPQEAYLRLKHLAESRLYGKDFSREPLKFRIAVAYSGGSDSSATVKVLSWAGFKVIPITARLPQMGEKTLGRVRSQGAVLVEVPGYMEEMRRLMEKRAPICGRCHSMVMSAVERKARELGIKVVASGDMLSVGSGSIYKKDGMIVLNLPAFLALNKAQLLEILGWKEYELKFGCPLWREAVKRAPIMKRFAIQRILRELRAGVLTEEMAKELIMDVLRA
ncbi:ATPase [Pyrococcus kukulkanii]|uniref:ATPase n=1 Tax=Pyrococcus kukulkanii TaxID=1609559 RepID=UPI003567143B